jgi:hypothetical protein
MIIGEAIKWLGRLAHYEPSSNLSIENIAETAEMLTTEMFQGVNAYALQLHQDCQMQMESIPSEDARPFLSGRRIIEPRICGERRGFSKFNVATSTMVTSYVEDKVEIESKGSMKKYCEVYRLVFAPTDQRVVREYKNHIQRLINYGISVGQIAMDETSAQELLDLIHPDNEKFNQMNPYLQMLEIAENYDVIRHYENALQIAGFLMEFVMPVQDNLTRAWQEEPAQKRARENGLEIGYGPDLIGNLMRKTIARINSSFDEGMMNERFSVMNPHLGQGVPESKRRKSLASAVRKFLADKSLV